VEQLKPLPDGSRNQLETLLTDLAGKTGLDGAVLAAVTGRRAASPEDVTAFIRALRGLTSMGPAARTPRGRLSCSVHQTTTTRISASTSSSAARSTAAS
jgi:hypothetical protein